jgi:hypothetical protein
MFFNPSWAQLAQLDAGIDEASRELATATRLIQNTEAAAVEARNWLAANASIYQGGQCLDLVPGVRPTFACDPDEQQDFALQTCLAAMLGCTTISEYLGASVNSNLVSLLASQACSANATAFVGGTYGLDAAGKTLLLDLLMNATKRSLRERAPLPAFLAAGLTYGVARHLFDGCTADASRKCARLYDEWQNGPDRIEQACRRNRQLIVDAPGAAAQARARAATAQEKLRVDNARRAGLVARKPVKLPACPFS